MAINDDEDQKALDPDSVLMPEEPEASTDLDVEEPDGDSDDVENDDGSVDVSMDDAPTADQGEFYDNLVPAMMKLGEDTFLDEISLEFIEKIEGDIKSWEKRDELYATGIKRTGLGNEAPGGASFLGASRAVHPMLIQAAVDFEARAMKELWPPTGPAKSQIIGSTTRKRVEKAERIAKCLNWQATKQIREWRSEQERGLMQASLNGGSYLVWRHDARHRRPACMSAPADKVIIPSVAADFYSAERITLIDDITEFEYRERVAGGIYYDVDKPAPSQMPDASKAQEARDKVEGKEHSPTNEDGVRRTYMVNTYLTGIEALLAGEEADENEGPLPYILYICDQTYKVLGLVRNWEEDDDKTERMHWITEIPFVPWETGGVGLVHLIGGLSAAATGSLRALLDAAHVNNVPTAAYLKGSTVSGQSKVISPTQLIEIAGGVGADDIRKVLMPMPFNEPSPTLYQLLGFVVEAGQGVVRTTFEKLSENNTNLPVGTTYALIEQGLTVVASIMGRQHYAMERTLEVLFRLNRMYLTDESIKDEAGEVLAYRSDFQGPMDIAPVSDPGIPSDAHRFAQTQALSQRADAKPELYNVRAVEAQVLKQLRIPEPDRFLVPEQKPLELNAANENVAATLGRPIVAFPEQDHISHLKTHLDYLQSPFFGFLSIIAPTFIPAILNHIKEHLAMWYVNKMYESLKTSVEAVSSPLLDGGDGDFSIDDFVNMKNTGVRADIDALIATCSDDVIDMQGGDAQELQQLQIIQVVQKAQQVMAQFQQNMPMDPSQAQLAKAQMDDKFKREKLASDNQMKVVDITEKRRATEMDTAAKQGQQQQETQRTVMQEQGENQRMAAKTTTEMQRAQMHEEAESARNASDNHTALVIAEAEIESGENVARSTGGDSSPGQ